jgi:hypothetical protein
VLGAESLNELDVLLLSAGLDENGHMGLTSEDSSEKRKELSAIKFSHGLSQHRHLL